LLKKCFGLVKHAGKEWRRGQKEKSRSPSAQPGEDLDSTVFVFFDETFSEKKKFNVLLFS
jgi:hypothetical protein